MESLQEYVLVDSETKTVEIFRRDQQGRWVFIPYDENDEITLMSLEITLVIDDIYEDVVLTKQANR